MMLGPGRISSGNVRMIFLFYILSTMLKMFGPDVRGICVRPDMMPVAARL